jgi:hypothetical protein
MERQGYVRAKVMCEKWGITTDKLAKLMKKGFTCDSFIVNGVRYISRDAKGPEATVEAEPEKTEEDDA